MQTDKFDSMTKSGYKIWFKRPELTPIDMEDIRVATENICRFNGHHKWSLLQHLALCTLLAGFHLKTRRSSLPQAEDTYLVAQCTCHDIHEVYVGDIVTGLKKHLSEFQIIENAWEAYVLSTLDLDVPEGEIKSWVKYIDHRALTLEMMGAHHLASSKVMEAFGLPDEEEINIYISVKKKDPDECWTIVKSAIDTYRQGKIYGESRNSEPNGYCYN